MSKTIPYNLGKKVYYPIVNKNIKKGGKKIVLERGKCDE